ncbi:MAG TPA: LysR substrate-binding domain-containing protein [Rhizomicrobium sp.]|nr:LysR substrate-binding domain-containing protein [Rhizomicrobium sp.]
MYRIPSLTALRTFEAVGRLGSIKAAAQELNVTPAAVTYQLRLLEEDLHTHVINRAANGLTLTKAGADLLAAVSSAFGAIHDTARRIREGSGRKILLIDSLPSFASCWLIPRLSSFYAENPEVEVEVNTVGDLGYPATVARTTNSVAIRVGLDDSQWPGLTAEKLVHEEMFPACAPSLLAGPVPLREPRDLAAHTLLIVSRRPEGWPEWLAAAAQYGDATDGVDPNHGRKFDTIQMATTAAIEGMGVVIGRKPLIDLYLKAGLLVEPFRLRIPSRTAYWLVTPPATAGAPLVQAFRCWLRRELGLPVTGPAIAA